MGIFNNSSPEAYAVALTEDKRAKVIKFSEFAVYSLVTTPLLVILTPILCLNLIRCLCLDFMDLLEEIINDDPVYSRRVTPLVSGEYFGDRKSFSTFTFAAVNDFKTLFMLGHYIPMKARAEKQEDLMFLSNYTRSSNGLSTDKAEIKAALYTLLQKMRPIKRNPRKAGKVAAILKSQSAIKRILTNYSKSSKQKLLKSELKKISAILSQDPKIDLSTQTDRIPNIDQLLTDIAQQVADYNQKQTQTQ